MRQGRISKSLMALGENYTVTEETPFHWATEMGAREVVEVPLERGADIEARDGKWRTVARGGYSQ
jgi:hypothetical protein